MSHPFDQPKPEFNEAARQMLFKRIFKRGEVIWADVPQYLDRSDDPNSPGSKKRPFIIMDEHIVYHVDVQGNLAEPLTLLGVNGTSKGTLDEGRPCLDMLMPHQKPGHEMITYFFADNICNVTLPCRR